MSDTELQSDNNNEPSDIYLKLFKGLGKVLNEVGVTGFVVIVIAIIVIYFPSPKQKEEIIDTWILFKGSNIPGIFIVIILLGLLVGQQIHYKKTIKLKDERISDLAKAKNSLYKNNIKTKLSTSHKKP